MNRAFSIAGERRRAKYGNRLTKVDGITFHSKREAERWSVLRLLEKAGEITNLRRQVKYRLEFNGVHIADYVCDFLYTEKGGEITEDAKGYRTPEYKLKAKLMLACHGIAVREV